MQTYLFIVQIILSITLTALVLLQGNKGAGLGGIFGGDGGIYKTRRGVEKTFFNATIVVSVLFFLVSILSVWASG